MDNRRKLALNLLIALGLLSQAISATAEPQSAVPPIHDHSNSGTSIQTKRPLNGKVSATQGKQSATVKKLKGSALKIDRASELQRQEAKSQNLNETANVNESQLATQTGLSDKVNQHNGDNNRHRLNETNEDNNQHGLNEKGGVNEPNGNNNQSGRNN